MAFDGKRQYKNMDRDRCVYHRYTLEQYTNLTFDDVTARNKEEIRDSITRDSNTPAQLKMWWGAESLDELKRLVRDGYPEGVRRAQESLDSMPVPPRASSFRRVKEYGRKGTILDVGRYLDKGGDLSNTTDLFYRRKRRKVRGRSRQAVYTLYIDLGANCNVSVEQYQWRGWAALQIAHAMRQAGASVRIIGYSNTNNAYPGSNKTPHGCMEVEIKPAGVPVNLDRLALFTMVPGMFRHFGFIAIADSGGLKVSGGFGSHNATQAPISAKPHDLIVSGSINTKQKATELVAQYIGFLNEEGGEAS